VLEKIEAVMITYHPRTAEPKELIPAAVLIPVFNKNDEAHLLLTLRTETVAQHKGQVSFPGGAREESDSSLKVTALRETEEEIGLSRENVRLLGALDDFPTVTNYMVRPFVGEISYPSSLKINKSEVARLLEVPFSLFLSEKNFEVKQWRHGNNTYPVYFYHFGRHLIWGATAYIINHFVDLVFGYNPAPNPVLRDPRNAAYLRENLVRRGTRSS